MTAALSHPDQLKELLGIPFNREQMAAIGAPLEPAVIVAGAGSGKTTVMAARVVWLVGSGAVRPEEVLGLTFTNKAAGELAERVRAALRLGGLGVLGAEGRESAAEAAGEPLGEPEISTYHAFAGRLLKEHGLRIGIEPDVRLLADATRFQLAAKVLRTARGPFPALTGTFANLVADLIALDGELAEHLVEPETLRAFDEELLDTLATTRLTNDDLRAVPVTARARLELLRLVEEYRRRKAAAGLMDFGDQIAAAARLAQQRPEVGELLRGQYRVVLLDEYQDTSVAQRLMLAGLYGAGPRGRGTGHPVTAVGDPCQAIYGWRGASVANLDDFPRHFPKADGSDAARYSLSENRRSGGRLLAFANELAEPLRAMHEGVEALRPAPGAEQEGYVRAALLPTHAGEIDWLADSIAHLVRTGTAPGRIAVLCRGGAAFPDIHAALVAREVPVEVVGLGGLLQLPEVADLVAACEVLQDPTANAALVRLLIGPRWRIGPRDLALLGRRAAELVRTARPEGVEALAAAVAEADPTEVVSLADALETFLDPADQSDELLFSAEARLRFARLARELRELRRSLAEPLMDVLHRVLAVTGLEVELAASPHALAARRRETLHAFLDVAAGFADLDGDPGLSAFLGFLRAAQEYERGLDSSLPGGEDTVKVLTAHKSKGLEWDVVAVPGLVKGAFPSSGARERWTSTKRVLPHALRGDAATLPDVRGGGTASPWRASRRRSPSTRAPRSCAWATSPSPGRVRCCWRPGTGGARARRPCAARPPSWRRCGRTASSPARASWSTGPSSRRRAPRTRRWPRPSSGPGRCRWIRRPSTPAAGSPRWCTAASPGSPPPSRSRWPLRTAARSSPGTAISPRWSVSWSGPGAACGRCRCPPRSPPPSCSGWPPIRTASRTTWPVRCRARRSPPPAGAPASTPGCSPGSSR